MKDFQNLSSKATFYLKRWGSSNRSQDVVNIWQVRELSPSGDHEVAHCPPPQAPQEKEQEHGSSPPKDPRAPRTVPGAALPGAPMKANTSQSHGNRENKERNG